MRKSLIMPLAASAFALTACVDSSYDFDNMDTTVRVEVKDFQIPLNLSTVHLDSILDINPGDDIQRMANGNYGVVKEGSFDTEGLSVDPITIAKPHINPIGNTIGVNITIPESVKKFVQHDAVLKVLGHEPTLEEVLKAKQLIPQAVLDLVGVPDLTEETQLLSFDIPATAGTDVNLSTDGIDKHVKGIATLALKNPVDVALSIRLKGLEGALESIHVNDLKLSLPSGFVMSNSDYDITTGSYTPSNKIVDPSNGLDLKLHLEGIDFAKSKADYALNADGSHRLNYSQHCSAAGSVALKVSDLKHDLTISKIESIKSLQYSCNIDFSGDIVINKFSGDIEYALDPITVDPVDLTSLPDFLKQSGTRLELANPQIYLSVNNPMAQSLSEPINIDIKLTPEPGATEKFEKTIVMPAHKDDVAYCYSPKLPDGNYKSDTNPDYDFSNAEWSEFVNLGKILSSTVNGKTCIPETIGIGVDVEKIDQHIADFELKHYGKIAGKYAFVAPLQFTDNTAIAYADTLDGWYTDDMEGMVVNSAKIEANVTSDIPLSELDITLYPVFISGNTTTIGTKQVGSVTLKQNSTSGKLTLDKAPFTVNVTGPLENLDGMMIKANVKASGKNPLGKDNKIDLNDIKVTVSGYYEKEL